MESLEVSFSVPWGIIQAKCWGHSSGRPFLGLHGWMNNANTFDKLVPLLPNDIYFVSIDFPGHGLSSCRAPAVPYTFFDWVVDVKWVISQLGWKTFSFVGHSMGASVASLYAGTFPDQIENLILLECRGPSVISDQDAGNVLSSCVNQLLSSHQQTTLKVFPNHEALASRMLQSNPELNEESARILSKRSVREDGRVVLTQDVRLKSAELRDVEGNYLVVGQGLLTSILSNVKCRVLVIQGSNCNPVFRIQYDFVKQRFEVLKNSATVYEYYEVPGNHFVHLNNAIVVVKKIVSFLRPTIKSKL